MPEHNDACGRDGDTPAADVPPYGAFGSAGAGAGSYTFRGQCLFFSSVNTDCCATKVNWGTALASGAANTHCTDKYTTLHDNWNSKHRSWRKKHNGVTPASAWPVTSLGRRLTEERPRGASGEDALVHELFLANGTSFWAAEELEEPSPRASSPRADAARANATATR